MSEGAAISRGMFIDEVEIVAQAGRGGDGCVAFRREKFVPHGGPSGGDGGDGGSVFIVADHQYNTLQHLAGHHHWKATPGGPGEGKSCHGKNGKDLHIRVPPGTLVRDDDTGLLLKDLSEVGASVCVAQGGKGGRGNESFKNSVNQAPRKFEPGTPGAMRRLKLELKLIADVGLVGKPNAGKSTLLSRMSAARPKIAAYPFTTRYPVLGIVELTRFRRFVMADIPGLIEGAHEGAGLGDEFLKHIERTHLLVHIIDVCPTAGDPVEDYRAIRAELKQYSPALAKKPEIIVANKMDLTDSEAAVERFRKKVRKKVLAVSGVTGTGLKELGEEIWRALHEQQ